MPKGSRVLVTGATGFTGSLLVRKLVGAGLNVSAIARASSRIEPLRDLPITWCRGEVFDPATVQAAARDVEYIFHVAAAFREAKYPDDYYRKVHVESTQLLAESAAANPRFKRFIHVSTMGVHGHIEHPPASEESPFHPGDIYQLTKAEGEQWIMDYARKHTLPLVVVRPCAIYGPGDRRLLKFFKLALKPVFIVLGYGQCLYHLIHVEDLTDILLAAATHPRAVGQVFLAGNTEAIPLKELAILIAAHAGRKPLFIRLPVTPFFWLAGACEVVFKALGKEPPLHRRRVAFFTKDRCFDTRKLRDVLEYRYRFDTRTGIHQTLDWYRAAGWLGHAQKPAAA